MRRLTKGMEARSGTVRPELMMTESPHAKLWHPMSKKFGTGQEEQRTDTARARVRKEGDER